VLVGASGSAWPFVPLKLPGAFFFNFDVQHHHLTWSSGNSMELLGMSEGACALSGGFLLAHLHVEDRYRVQSALAAAIDGLQPFATTYRWERPDTNECRLLHCRAMLDAEERILKGFLIDLSSDRGILAGAGDILAATSLGLSQLGMQGYVIDTELRVISTHSMGPHDALSLGLPGFTPSDLRAGQHFVTVFKDAQAQADARELLSKALCSGIEVHEWGNWKAEIRTVLFEGIPCGLTIAITDNTPSLALSKLQTSVDTLNDQITSYQEGAKKLLDTSQELVGVAALIARSETSNPLVRHASEALITIAKESAKGASIIFERSLHGHSATASQGNPARPTGVVAPMVSPLRTPTIQHRRPFDAVVASRTLRSARTLSSLLRDSGIACTSARLSEIDLKELLQSSPHIRAIVIDTTGEPSQDLILIRRILNFFPALKIIALAHGLAGESEKLSKAGAYCVLEKPVAPREIERLIKRALSHAA